jgi:hypothetical protein
MKHTPSVHDLLFDVDQVPIEDVIREHPLLVLATCQPVGHSTA